MAETPDENPRAIWDRIAPWWSQQIGEGNDFQIRLIMPATDRLLQPAPGLRVLDVACGNGNYSRRLGRAGCRVLAFDGSANFIADARRRTTPDDGQIDYHVCDATDAEAMRSLADAGTFDVAVSSMAVMDFPVIEPLLSAVHTLLKPGGAFIYSVSHPCFNSNGSRMTAELINEEGRTEQVFGVHIRRYLEPTTDLSSGILNQPEPHYGYHRSLSTLFAAAFAAGFVVDGFEEPSFPVGGPAKNVFSWAKRPDIPPACVIRLRRQG